MFFPIHDPQFLDGFTHWHIRPHVGHSPFARATSSRQVATLTATTQSWQFITPNRVLHVGHRQGVTGSVTTVLFFIRDNPLPLGSPHRIKHARAPSCRTWDSDTR